MFEHVWCPTCGARAYEIWGKGTYLCSVCRCEFFLRSTTASVKSFRLRLDSEPRPVPIRRMGRGF